MSVPELNLYQQQGSYFLFHQQRAILADEMGLGKTVQAIQAMKSIVITQGLNSVLVVVPGSALYVWEVELQKWWPEFAHRFTMITGTQDQRDKFWLHPDTIARHNFGICTYDVLKRDFKRGVAMMVWHLVIFDEAHKMKNRKTQNYLTAKKMTCVYMFILTGTPASKGPQDLWPLLNLCAPREYTSYWKFLDSYCITSRPYWGGLEILGVKDADKLKKRIAPIFLRRLKKEVLEQLPPKTRSLLPIEMKPAQKKMYDILKEEMVLDLEKLHGPNFKDPVIVSDILAKITRMRQLLCSPRLLDPELEEGAGIEAIAEMIEGGEHCVIFTSFPSAFPFFAEYLMEQGIGDIYMLRGGMNIKEMAYNIDNFKSKRGIMLASIEHAQGYSLETASLGFMLGYSWKNASNFQAEDRLHRLTSKSAVNIYYMQHKGSVDDRVLEILNTNQTNIDAIMQGNFTYDNLRSVLSEKEAIQ